MDILISGRAARGFILANWLYKDGPEKAREWLDLTMKLLADGVMTPPTGDVQRVVPGSSGRLDHASIRSSWCDSHIRILFLAESAKLQWLSSRIVGCENVCFRCMHGDSKHLERDVHCFVLVRLQIRVRTVVGMDAVTRCAAVGRLMVLSFLRLQRPRRTRSATYTRPLQRTKRRAATARSS